MTTSRRELMRQIGSLAIGGGCLCASPFGSARAADEEVVCSFAAAGALPNTTDMRPPALAAIQAVKAIADCAGIAPNFEVVEGDFWLKSVAYATIADGRRYVVYDREAFDWNGAGPGWTAITVFAHEIGHHINGHTIAGGPRWRRELEADQFAGFAVSRLGGQLEDVLRFFRATSAWGSWTHPPRGQRLDAAETGWRNAEASKARAALGCASEWIGDPLTIDGRTCRIAKVCDGSSVTHRLACERAGRWSWQ